MTRLILGLFLILGSVAQAACDWPAWQQFKHDYITEQGRVIDPSSPEKITTSEGQSYAMFFALVANDKTTFDLLLNWTENNLAKGDLTARLPAWLWGESQEKQWTILDDNSASDADLWIAYNLLEAGRLWKNRRYQVLGVSLLNHIAREEVVNVPDLGYILLPGKHGFVSKNSWKLNPSYQPPQLLARFSALDDIWHNMQESNARLLIESAPKGFSPNWILWNDDKTWSYDDTSHDLGSYDAIRVYLWVGMLADDDKHKSTLMAQLKSMMSWVETHGLPPEKIATASGTPEGQGPVGFSAALLPFLHDSTAIDVQRKRVAENQPGADAYYSAVLTLFGQGWDQQRYRFNVSGELLPDWSHQCTVPH